MSEFDFEDGPWGWLATEALYASALTPADDPELGQRVVVRDAGARWAGIVAIAADGTVTINGTEVDLADYLPVILGLVDEVYAASGLEGKEVYLEGSQAW